MTKMTKEYAVVYAETGTGWGAHAPDLPGLGVAGETFEETEILIHDGILFHIEGLREDKWPVPAPETRVAMLAVTV